MTTNTLSKSAAIKAARAAVGQITRTGEHSWVFSTPKNPESPNGPSTEVHNNSRSAALRDRTERVADVALCLLGCPETYVQAPCDGTTVEELVAAGLRHAKRMAA